MTASTHQGIIILFGPSGVGKSSVASELVRHCPDLWLSRSWTTRPRRPQETTENYEFVDTETFQQHMKADGFLEWDKFLGNFYGTPKPSAPPGKDVLLEITLQGATQVQQTHPESLLIFVDTPSLRDQKRRLKRRGDNTVNIRKRLRRSKKERNQSSQIRTHTVINDDLLEAVGEITRIIMDARRRNWQ